MTPLPAISADECVKALQRAGFVVRRQTGSHIILKRPSPYGYAVVPNHKEIDPGTLGNIIAGSGLSVSEFIDLLKKKKKGKQK